MSAFEKIAAGLNDAIAYATGDAARAHVRSGSRPASASVPASPTDGEYSLKCSYSPHSK